MEYPQASTYYIFPMQIHHVLIEKDIYQEKKGKRISNRTKQIKISIAYYLNQWIEFKIDN